MRKIEPGTVLTKDQQRALKAVFELAGIDQRAFSGEHQISYYRLNRMLNGREAVTPNYARRLNALCQETPLTF